MSYNNRGIVPITKIDNIFNDVFGGQPNWTRIAIDQPVSNRWIAIAKPENIGNTHEILYVARKI
jgi:hypothetical protein